MPELEEPGIGGELEPVEATPIFSPEKEASIKSIVNALWDTTADKASIARKIEHDLIFGKYASSEHYKIEDLQALVQAVAETKPVVEVKPPTEEELAIIAAKEKAEREKVKAKILELWDEKTKASLSAKMETEYIFGPLGISEHRLIGYYQSIIDEVAVELDPPKEIIEEVIP